MTEIEKKLADYCAYRVCVNTTFLRNCDICMYEKGKEDRETEIIDTIEQFAKDWNNQSSKKIPYKAINELVEYIRQDGERRIDMIHKDLTQEQVMRQKRL